MGTCGNLFQASTRSATISKRRGAPSSGRALNVVTGTKAPADNLRRSGSSNVARPAPTGTNPAMVPRQTAAHLARNSRRSGWAGLSCWSGMSDGFIAVEFVVAGSDASFKLSLQKAIGKTRSKRVGGSGGCLTLMLARCPGSAWVSSITLRDAGYEEVLNLGNWRNVAPRYCGFDSKRVNSVQ